MPYGDDVSSRGVSRKNLTIAGAILLIIGFVGLKYMFNYEAMEVIEVMFTALIFAGSVTITTVLVSWLLKERK